MTEQVHQNISWEEVDNLCEKIATEIKQLKKPLESIYPIQRGGLVPAAILSRKLGLPINTNKCDVGPYSLIVDDISDSGETLKPYKGLHIVCLHHRHSTESVPLVSGQILLDETWIVYPWEDIDEERIPGYKKNILIIF